MQKNSNVQEQDINCTAIASRIAKDIDEYCVKTYDKGHRNHLGASLIGDKCSRKLWYIFRWCFREKTDGRKQRLFNRGHREEDRFIEWLEGIGAKVCYENYEGFCYHAESDSYCILTEKELENSSLDLVLPSDENFKFHLNI